MTGASVARSTGDSVIQVGDGGSDGGGGGGGGGDAGGGGDGSGVVMYGAHLTYLK